MRCLNVDHDHAHEHEDDTPTGMCADCGQPIHYDEGVGTYFHTLSGPDCFLAGQRGDRGTPCRYELEVTASTLQLGDRTGLGTVSGLATDVTTREVRVTFTEPTMRGWSAGWTFVHDAPAIVLR